MKTKGYKIDEDLSDLFSKSIDWLNEHHFDYRWLIDKRLALNATGLNIY